MGGSSVPKLFRPKLTIRYIFRGDLYFFFAFKDSPLISFLLLLLMAFYRVDLSLFYIPLLSTKAISVFLSFFLSTSLSSRNLIICLINLLRFLL